jgi:predicted DNA-binding transcriptional regulator AlpA
MSTEQAHLLNRVETCRFFGNIHPSTLWRGIRQGRFPAPIHISTQVRRWSRSECETALQQMANGRGHEYRNER